MNQYETIRTMHRVYGKSIREIARLTGHSRKLIRKVLKNEPWCYKTRTNQTYPKLGPFLGIVKAWLKTDKDAPKKQRHTARRIYNRLRSEHQFEGSESNVRRLVRGLKAELGLNGPGAFIPGDPQTTVEAEADWGTAVVKVKGNRRTVKFFCMRSKYSGKMFVRAYFCERQQAFFDAHILAFLFFGGVFKKIIFDNLKTAVKKLLKGSSRIEQDSFIKFRSYYSFAAVFTNADSGNEKGGVEGLVGFARRNFMVPIPEIESLEEFNIQLLEECIKYGSHKIDGRTRTVQEDYEIEKRELLELPSVPFSNVLVYSGKSDKYATVILDKNRYSVPTSYAGRSVSAVLEVGRVKIYSGKKCLAIHERVYGEHKWQLNPEHYLDLLRQRPRAFDSARPIRQWRNSWPESYPMLLERFRETHGIAAGTKAFIDVLSLHKEYGDGEVEGAVELAIEYNISNFAGVKHLLFFAMEETVETLPLENYLSQPEADISVYGQLGAVL